MQNEGVNMAPHLPPLSNIMHGSQRKCRKNRVHSTARAFGHTLHADFFIRVRHDIRSRPSFKPCRSPSSSLLSSFLQRCPARGWRCSVLWQHFILQTRAFKRKLSSTLGWAVHWASTRSPAWRMSRLSPALPSPRNGRRFFLKNLYSDRQNTLEHCPTISVIIYSR